MEELTLSLSFKVALCLCEFGCGERERCILKLSHLREKRPYLRDSIWWRALRLLVPRLSRRKSKKPVRAILRFVFFFSERVIGLYKVKLC